MQTNVTVRHDQFEEAKFRDMMASEPFRLLTARIAGELERARTDCERKGEPTEIYRAQGSAAALRAALALPETIAKELAGRKP